MQLYCSKTSPHSRKVRVALIEQGLADRVEEILIDPFNPTPEFLAANPLSKIPTLITDRGEALPSSDLILDYLQARHSGIAALPRGSRRWSALRLRQIGEGVIDAAVATVFEKRRPESIVYVPHLDRQLAAIQRSLELLNLEAATLGVQTPSVVEITVGVALSYLDFRLPYVAWRKSHAALEAWHDGFSQRASMQLTRPPES
jgi:glutathione S-transferase